MIKHGTSTISCDGCRGELHLSCIGLNADDVRVTRNKSRAIKIICNSCQRFMGELGDLKGYLLSLKDDFNKKISELELKVDALIMSDTAVIQRSVDDLHKKIESLETDTSANTPVSLVYEDLIGELFEREKRKRNLMVFGMSEIQSDSRDERVGTDRDKIMGMLKSAGLTLRSGFSLKLLRLGKYTTDRCRPIKVVLEHEDDVLWVVKKAKYLRSLDGLKGVYVSFDRTPRQIDQYKLIKKQLDDRLGKGESNIKIRYVKGCPKIVATVDNASNLN